MAVEWITSQNNTMMFCILMLPKYLLNREKYNPTATVLAYAELWVVGWWWPCCSLALQARLHHAGQK